VALIACLLAAGIAPRPAPSAEPFAAMGLTVPSRTRAAADFTLTGVAGQTVRLGDARGQVVLLNFWATWCPACRAEMPSIQRLHARFKDKGLAVLAVSVDRGGAEAVAAFATDHAITFPIALDPGMAVADRYGVRALPSTFLLDRDGRIRALAVGPREWDASTAHTVIAAFLAPAGERSSRNPCDPARHRKTKW
jgi:peroxiredoxin